MQPSRRTSVAEIQRGFGPQRTRVTVLGLLAFSFLFAAGLNGRALAEPALQDVGWPNHGRDLAETRYAPLDRINATNVGSLAPAWSWEIPKGGARIETTPIVFDGILYGTGPMSYVFALDAASGELIWEWDPAIPPVDAGGPGACCGSVNRGVALHGGLVYVGLLDGRLVALDRRTGRTAWSVQTTPPGSDYSITGAPRIISGAVVIGNGGAEYGVRGYVSAYDLEDGGLKWRTYTVPGNPALGFENSAMRRAAETWRGRWWTAGGGGTVWDGMAYDPSLGIVYVGTGNGSPWSRDHRSPGGGDNLYLSSILALREETGEIIWHYQTTPGDDWDYTATQPLMLLDLEIDGSERWVIVQAPKNGFFYVIDRLSGDLISALPFADDITWATEVDLVTERPVETPEARYGINERGAYLAPGPRGAHNWNPMAWSENTRFVYIPATNNNYYYEKADRFEYALGQWNTGTIRRGGSGTRPARPKLTGPANLLLAWDPALGREVWRVPGQGRHGGVLATGKLIFWTNGDELLALRDSDGGVIWKGIVGPAPGSPITYVAGGRQYVAAAGGGEAVGRRIVAFALPN